MWGHNFFFTSFLQKQSIIVFTFILTLFSFNNINAQCTNGCEPLIDWAHQDAHTAGQMVYQPYQYGGGAYDETGSYTTTTCGSQVTMNMNFTAHSEPSNGIAGLDYRILQSSNATSTFKLTFTKPVVISNLTISDVDQKSGYVDRMEFTANNNGTNVPISFTGQYVSTSGQTVYSSSSVQDIGYVTATTSQPVTEISIYYSNGNHNGAEQFILINKNFRFCCPSACNAGSHAPTLASTNLHNTCPTTTVNLNNNITSSAPSGTVLQWHTSSINLSSSTKYSTPTTAGAGTYYAFYYDATNNCYSPASSAVTVNIQSCIDPCDAASSGNSDIDNDGISDICDLDNDNDGILDSVEYGCTTLHKSGTWHVSGTTAQYDYGNGIIAKVTTNTPNNFATEYFNYNIDPWSGSVSAGNTSLLNNYKWESTLTINFEDQNGNPVRVKDPVLHFDRVGTVDNYIGGSAEITLLDGLQWTELSGTQDFQSTSTTVYDASVGQSTSNNAESSNDYSSGTAAGSLKVLGMTDTVKVAFVRKGSANPLFDEIELILSVCPPRDTDHDGTPDYLDTDSDNDGCPDALEAMGNFTTSNLINFGTDGANGVNNSLNFTVNNNGVPTINGVTGQATSPAVTNSAVNTACATDLSLTQKVNNALPKVGENITYTLTVKNVGTATATNVKIKDLLPNGVTYISHYSSLATSTYTDTDADNKKDTWSIASINTNTSITLQITAKVNGAGTLTNTAEITDSDKPDIDSTVNNGK